ncbi:MAG: hypothetical protein D6729_12565 [Deltaproteobacteria bacterium]|nr:MAG: hypothetical protein D6729_12565 [Deltaproteobacteria bacterium]
MRAPTLALTALSLAAAAGTSIACGSPSVTITEPLGVVNWSPHDGATGIEVDWVVSVCLTRPLDAETLGNATLRVDDGNGAPGGDAVAKTATLTEADPACLEFSKEPLLDPGTTYHIVLGPDLAAEDGMTLGRTLSSQFTTAP